MLNIKRINERLKEKEMTEYRLAKNINVSTGHMAKLMAGNIKDPRFELVCKIADALEITVDELRKKDK
ncbi:helix-turn-helix domain-containing protein [Enterococcus avium]|uniref:helix-turn-helix domain-containing protein n=1 Tax=Enterococcus avium TaxID=33945 RepID=UPI00288FCCC7|nr:helix-turn-helix transcriptional regulator [Enterococcus avium]MDT2400667.1 helix-turn-helix transcriptional regulator [Enterococcus avium]MDT2438244.1 helix-turn-helix transcriptional regulator [Enterococcus avium]MDT2485618.1 helix-turn-helix transcriptional regulator [Enterococcus avium]MDT2512222.1 helix-turn-helix transcriptional regulator [Enterococcus avium]